MERLERSFAADAPADFKSSFYQAGWNVLGADGGASSSLLGAFFLGMADSPEKGACSLDCTGLANAFHAGLRNVQEQTKALPGDKTMMDALVPAVEGFVAATGSGGNINGALREAALAARNGAEATRLLTARYGRAKLLGEKTRGHVDPGAMSIALIFEGFYQGITELKGEVGNG
jgi:dihydroxyacetone kinase-like protein